MVQSVLSPLSLTSYYDPFDQEVLQAQLYFYKAGTLDPVGVYTDSGLGIPHAQPVLTGGSGRVPPVWIGEIGRYRVRAFDSFDQLIEDLDNMPPAPPPATAPPPADPVDPTKLIQTGDILSNFSGGGTRVGYVRCNGLTIGSATSGATERANADAMNLFKYLWQSDSGNMLAVLPSKGASSDGDWTANKQITLPDLRGRSLFGVDGMGNGSMSNRLSGAHFAAGTASVIGANGGTASVTLTTAELPAHNHVLTDPKHNHVLHDPQHNHTLHDPQHSHSYQVETFIGGTSFTPVNGGGLALRPGTTGPSSSGVWIDAVSTGVTLDEVATGITLASTGDGLPFSQISPFLLTVFYIRL
jgi:microcystin-dependent protein